MLFLPFSGSYLSYLQF